MESTLDIDGHVQVFNKAVYYAFEILEAFVRWPVFQTSLWYSKPIFNQLFKNCVKPIPMPNLNEKETTIKLIGIKDSGEHA